MHSALALPPSPEIPMGRRAMGGGGGGKQGLKTGYIYHIGQCTGVR